jgi:hypothetical protein
LCGAVRWRTRSVFKHYAIVSRTDIADAMLKLQRRKKANGKEIDCNIGHSNISAKKQPTCEVSINSCRISYLVGAERGTRTPTSRLSPADFKSAASASSAIPAWMTKALIQ